MTTFAYIAFDSKGKSFRGSVQEKSWTQAIRRVKEMGLFPNSVKEKPRRAPEEKRASAASGPGAVGRARIWPSFVNGIPAKVLSAFTRQMATLIEAGIPILRA